MTTRPTNKLLERLNLALGQDATIVTDVEGAKEHKGNTTEYLVSLGLEKQDLKRLERNGLAIRARTYNGQMHFKEEGQNIRISRQFGPGSRIKWILLAP